MTLKRLIREGAEKNEENLFSGVICVTSISKLLVAKTIAIIG
jgi:hypothetical protein